MTSPDDGEPQVPSPDTGDKQAGKQPPRHVASGTDIVWGPPPRPGDPPFGAPQQFGGRGMPRVRWSPGTDQAAGGPINRGGVIALVFGITGLFLVILPPIGVLFGVFAIRAGLRARRRAAVTHGVAPGSGAGILTGIAAIIASSLVMIVALVFIGELRDYQDCMSGANTNAAERDCRDRLNEDIRRRVGLT